MALISFSIVFLVIIGLMLLMMGLKYFTGIVNPKGTDAPGETTPVQAKAPEANLSQAATVAAGPATAGASPEDDELAAVITAAITAATGAAAKVLSFVPSQPNETRAGHGTPVWRMTGVLSNMRGLRE